MNKCNICGVIHEKKEPMTDQQKEEIIKMGKRITNHDNGVHQQTPDEKVLDYLKRANKIEELFFGYPTKESVEVRIVEIAKLLQREESK